MRGRFQADADLNAEIVAGVPLRREPSIDFQTADEANLRRFSDPEVLTLAAQENRILVTHDRLTMPRHFADFSLHHSNPGVFIIAQTVEFIPIKPWVAMASDARESYATHNRLP
jgi:predicted nuclease of predicted toxin-antitoxin system